MKAQFFASVLFVCAVFSATQTTAQTPKLYEENAIYVRFKASASPKTAENSRFIATEKVAPLQKLQKSYGLHQSMFCMRTLGASVLERTFELKFDSTAKADELIRLLEQDSRIELVERIPVAYIQGQVMEKNEPQAQDGDDPYYTGNYIWHLNLIHAEAAWAQQTGNADIKVAVVDNAIWGNHPDLAIDSANQYNIASGQTGNSAPPANVPQDPNCSNINSCPSYNWSHGTHCAGAIGAIRGNGVGIASIGSGITLMGVSCPGSDASGLAMGNGFTGVSWAAEHGARVISLSWGKYTITETDRAIIQACIDHGIIIVAAAGNDRYRNNPMYPAYLPGVISVASVNSNRQISSFSNYGEWVTVASPGGFLMSGNTESKTCIFSTTYCTSQNYRLNGHPSLAGQYYDGMYGTSMATPIVSGLCGLLLSAEPTLSPYLMREILTVSAQPIDQSNDKGICANSGIIDAAAAIRLIQHSARIARPHTLEAERIDRRIELKWQKPETENEVIAYQVFLDNIFAGETDASQTSFTQSITEDYKLYRFGVRALYANGDTSLRTGLDIQVPALYDINVTVKPEGCGTIEGTGAHPANETVRLVARAAKGCTFTRWIEDIDGKPSVLGNDSVLDYKLAYNEPQIRAMFTGTPDPTANDIFETASPLRIYPNPTANVINIDGGESVFHAVAIYSVTGQRLLTQSFSQGVNTKEINIENLNAGTYVVKVLTAKGWRSEKITKF